MRRRSKAGGEPAKAPRRKTGARKSGGAPKVVRPRSSSTTNLESEVARLSHELHEALERQTATSEVLQAISRSSGELEPVFATMLEKAVRICDAMFGGIYRWDGNALASRRRIIYRPLTPRHAGFRRFVPVRSTLLVA